MSKSQTAARRAPLRLALVAAVCATPVLVAPATAAQAAPAAAAASSGRETLRTQSVQTTVNNAFTMKAWKQREDIASAASMADVIGWQEILKPVQRTAIREQEGWATYWPGGFTDGEPTPGSKNASPISYLKSKWKRIGVGTELSSPAFDGVAQERWLSWVLLRDRETGIKVARWNLHFVPGAFSKRGTDAQRRQRPALRQAWRKQVAGVSNLIDELAPRTHAVIGGGDVNRLRHEFLGDKVAYDTNLRGLDYLVHLPNAFTAHNSYSRVPMHSDHQAVRVVYDLKRWRPRR